MAKVYFPLSTDAESVLTTECIGFLIALHQKFEPKRQELLKQRKLVQKALDNGAVPDFLKETEYVRNSDWTVAPIPKKLLNRTIEIVARVNRKMIIHALNSGADGFMADFEDPTAPSWDNLINGQINLRDAVHDNINFVYAKTQKSITLKDKFKNLPALHVRTRGLHLPEAHFLIDGKEMSGSFFDFGVYFFHNGKKLAEQEIGPYFYLPKLESYKEARLWNEVFMFSQRYVGIPVGTIRATVIIEHILLAFQMDEVLYELRDHSGGLSYGGWDYIFSCLKKFHNTSVLPDKHLITMKTHFMDSYAKLLTQSCHRREVHAMGGMATSLPVKDNEELNKKNLERVYQDKLNEVQHGMDGAWVAHPVLISVARKAFEKYKPADKPNQIELKKSYNISAFDILKIPSGPITEETVRDNVSTSLQYLEAWLNGIGAVAINHKLEGAATAEISRIQLWNWIAHRYVNGDFVRKLIEDERSAGSTAKKVLLDITFRKELTEFMLLEAYPYLISKANVIKPKL